MLMTGQAAWMAAGLVFVVCTCSVGAAQEQHGQPGTQWSEQQLREAIAPMRAGRKLTPRVWPHGSRVAVCLSWDMDNEVADLAVGTTAPIRLSFGEYGATEGFPRIIKLYDRYNIPGSFYIPAVTGLLYPALIAELKKRPQHEIGIHGWIHENLAELNNLAEEQRLLNQTLDFWTHTLGKRPVGFRAPAWEFSKYTLDLLQTAGFEYDTSAMAMDEPYEIVSQGKPAKLIELPVTWVLDDYIYFAVPGVSPDAVFKIFQDEFDGAYKEGTYFMLTMHPMITGHRSRIMYLEKLIAYIKSKPGVWFATGQQIAEYVKQQDAAHASATVRRSVSGGQ